MAASYVLARREENLRGFFLGFLYKQLVTREGEF